MGHNYPRLRRRRAGGAAAVCAAVMLSVVAATGVSGAAAAMTAAPASAGAVLSVPGAGAVRIVRDEYGVPHIFASTARALFYGEGYAVAQDRLWQAERLRLTGTGTVAAVYRFGGPGSVPGDLNFREYTGGEGHLRALVAELPAPARVAVRAFCDGMNSWIRTAIRTHTLPPEYAFLRLTPARGPRKTSSPPGWSSSASTAASAATSGPTPPSWPAGPRRWVLARQPRSSPTRTG